MVEERVTRALRRGDSATAATEVIRGYGPQVLAYLARVLRSAEDAHDAFSFFAEWVWKGLARFEGRSSVRVWAYRVAWTAALRVQEDGWRRRRERFPSSMASRVAAEVLSHGAQAAEREAEALERLRSALEPEERSLLVLRLDRRLSWKEIAQVMEAEGRALDEAALRKRFERLKEKLTRLARGARTG
ncbi:MAG: sigma-70 family RNA polymerase sigma factor [Deltaproteobacteria bacterium]|nr:sigma-70 family RNA polymerase sigma factor [Deltaproteobacteria bacterium]